MNKVIVGLLCGLIATTASAYTLFDQTEKNRFAGNCDRGGAFAGSVDYEGYYTISGPSGNHFSKSLSEAIRKACGE